MENSSSDKYYHLNIDVRSNLRKSDSVLLKEQKGLIKDEDEGKILETATDIRKFWEDQLAQGRECIVLGKSSDCPDFDYKGGGCPGHPIKKTANA